MKKITARCWTGTNPVKLYADGDPLGQRMFARAGQFVRDADVAGFDAASQTAFVASATVTELGVLDNPGGPYMTGSMT